MQNTALLLSEIDTAKVEALIDPDNALRVKVENLYQRAFDLSLTPEQRREASQQASLVEARLARKFAEGCLQQAITLRTDLYRYVDKRVAGEEARLPQLMDELYGLLEAHNKAAGDRYREGVYMTRALRNALPLDRLGYHWRALRFWLHRKLAGVR